MNSFTVTEQFTESRTTEMHKVIYWKDNPKYRKEFYFEHYKKYNDIHIFTLGTADEEILYVPDSKLVKILWDNSIIQRRKK